MSMTYSSAKNLHSRLYQGKSAIFRRKSTANEYSKLIKTLNLFDVTFLSIGTSLGVGPFIFVGHYAALMGPSMVLAYLIAGAVALLSAACYAELSCRESGCGGAYTCAYRRVGELPAVLCGWLLCLQSVIGSALSVRGLSEIINFHLNFRISNFIKRHIVEFETPFLALYPDFICFLIEFFIITLLAFVVKEITRINNFFVSLNLFFLLLIILVSGSNLNWHLWNLPETKECGAGGFFPYGADSIFANIGFVFYAYLGFDAAAHAAAESKDPERIVPLALIVSTVTVMILYILQSITYTLIWSYCDQDLESPIPYVMGKMDINIMSWISIFGVPLAVFGSVLSSTFPLSRIIYAMAEDGLLLSFMAKINMRTKVPVNALYTAGLFTSIFATLMDMKHLAELTSLTTLLVYIVTAVMLIYLRYTDIEMETSRKRDFFKLIFNVRPKALVPTSSSSNIVAIISVLIALTAFPANYLLKFSFKLITEKHYLGVLYILFVLLFYIFLMVVISSQPKSESPLTFKVKPVPLLPVISILLNAFITLHFSQYTWIIVAVLIFLGLILYATYGIWNSKLRNDDAYF